MKKMLLTISMLLVAESNAMKPSYRDITKKLEQLAESADSLREFRERIASESPSTDEDALNFSAIQAPSKKDELIAMQAEIISSTLKIVRRMVPNAGELAQKLDLRKLTDLQVLGAAIDAEQAREKAERAVNRAINSPSPKTSPRSPMSVSKRSPSPMRQVGPMSWILAKPVATRAGMVMPAIVHEEETREFDSTKWGMLTSARVEMPREEGIFDLDSDDVA